MNPSPDEKTSECKGMSFDILTVLGHDLKSPLNAVESYLEIIRGKVLGEDINSYLPIVGNSISRLHRMRELITDVVDWSRIRTPSSSRVPHRTGRIEDCPQHPEQVSERGTRTEHHRDNRN